MNDEGITKPEMTKVGFHLRVGDVIIVICHSTFFRHSCFVIRYYTIRQLSPCPLIAIWHSARVVVPCAVNGVCPNDPQWHNRSADAGTACRSGDKVNGERRYECRCSRTPAPWPNTARNGPHIRRTSAPPRSDRPQPVRRGRQKSGRNSRNDCTSLLQSRVPSRAREG